MEGKAAPSTARLDRTEPTARLAMALEKTAGCVRAASDHRSLSRNRCMKSRLVMVVITGLVGASAGCRRPTSAPDPLAQGIAARRSAATVKTYKLVGVVRQVDGTSGSVTIRHEAIPGFM